jgi:phospholipid/cholesterol/gamma-HCH transport system substrate-binding protein
VKSFRERRAWLVGIASILVIGAGMAFAFSLDRFDALRGVYRISADLEDAAGLVPGNEVRVAGIKVGSVTNIRLVPGAARIEMEIARDIRIPKETKLEVKLKTLLGQKFIDLQIPRSFTTAASGGGDPSAQTDGFLSDGDLIPKDQTRIPYEIYEAATEGTETLEQIDKGALRQLVSVLGKTVDVSKEEIGAALESLNDAGAVLASKGPEIRRLLRSTQRVTGTLAAGGADIEGILTEATDVFGVLADRRATTSSLLAATEDLANNFGLLIQAARGSVKAGVSDLNDILVVAEAEIDSINEALAELPTAQEMFGRPGSFGRFIEGHVCAITTEDTCVPEGSPGDPGVPVKGTQPEGSALNSRFIE